MTASTTRPLDAATEQALDAARHLAEHGVPIFLVEPALDDGGRWVPDGGHNGCGYWLPADWQRTTADPAVVDRWRPGKALAAVMGHAVDGVDVDPRHGGHETADELRAAGCWPRSYGRQRTPSGGWHDLVAPLRVRSRDGVLPGVDVKAGHDGHGHGFLFLAPTTKLSKATGEIAAYTWTVPPDLDELDPLDDTGGTLAARIEALRAADDTEAPDVPHDAYDAMTAPQRGRVDRYLAGVVRGIGDELAEAARWPEGYRDARKRGWQKVLADACNRFGRLARADWTPWTYDDARAALTAVVPRVMAAAVDLDATWRAQRDRRSPAPYPPSLAEDWTALLPAATPAPAVEATVAENGPQEAAQAPQRGDDGDSDAPEPGSTWAPVDLTSTVDGLLAGNITRLMPTVAAREDGACLFYRGKVNGVAGASGSGKTWTGLAASVQQIDAGEHVVYVDLEDDAVGVVGRLLDLGVDPAAVLARFHYVHPDEPYSAQAAAHLVDLVKRVNAALVVIDSTGESMALDGAKPNEDDDAARWFRRLPTPLARLGAAVLVLDHVVKSDDGGLWPIGSQRKRAAISGAQYMQLTVRAFAKDTAGVAKLVCAKDRHGNYRPGQRVADLSVTPTGDGIALVLRVPDEARAAGGDGDVFRPTAIMEKVSRALESAGEALTFRGVDERVQGKQAYVALALDLLVAEGYVERQDGPRRSKLHTTVRPYRQADDPASDAYEPGRQSSASECRVSVSPLGGETGDRHSLSPGDSRETVGDSQTVEPGEPTSSASSGLVRDDGTSPQTPECLDCGEPLDGDPLPGCGVRQLHTGGLDL